MIEQDGARASQLVESIAHHVEVDVLPTLEQYTAIECLSPSFDAKWRETGAIDQAARLLKDWCDHHAPEGSSAEIIVIDEHSPVLFVEIPAHANSNSESTTLIYGHMDKQPPLGNWREGLEPFRAVREGDRLYGRGTADDGYSCFAAITAIEALVEVGAMHGRIVILIEASEESGSPDLSLYLDLLANRIGAIELIVCLDSGCPTYDRLWMTSSVRGIIVGTLRVDVLDEAVHSGLGGGVVASSFRIARSLLSRIEDEQTGEILLEEAKEPVPPTRRKEIEQASELLGDDALGSFHLVSGLSLEGASPADRLERASWRASLSVTGAEGLPGLEQAGNVIRPYTALKLSLRLPPTSDSQKVAAALERVLTEDPPFGARVQYSVEQPADGWEAEVPAPWLEGVLQSSSQRFFGSPVGVVGLGGTIPFLGELAQRYPSAQFLATGVLGPESNAHGPNESLHLPTVRSLIAVLSCVLAEVP